jgi:hypothetical protein
MGSTMSLALKVVIAVFIAPFPKTKIQAAELRMSGSCSLLVLRINFLGLQVRLCTTFSVINVGECILPWVRKKTAKKRVIW